MVQKIKKYAFPAASYVLTLLTALFWVALRINHSGISKFLGADTNPTFLIMNLPIMVCVAAWIGVAFSIYGLWSGKKWASVTAFVIGMVMLVGGVVVVYFGARDYLRFIMGHFWLSAAVSGCITAIALILFFPPRWSRTVKALVIAVIVLFSIVIGYQLRPCRISTGAVVYAVEDNYQIVFSTSDQAIAWVEIGGEAYYDLYAGSMRSADRVHKIEVPQTVLDAAGGYTICAKQMIYRGPFGGYTGETLSQIYTFRPVDTADGLDYFTLSDVHEAVDAASQAATTRDGWDFIVLLGDLVSMVETEDDANLANELAHRITGGEIPVIYARGNHEIKGEEAENLYKYVGSRNQDFYYTVTLGADVFAVVLDLGEDHEDDWWEYYGTAQFDLYREDQIGFLQELLASGEYEAYRYRMAISHVPIVYVDEGDLFGDYRRAYTSLLNEMEIDISLSGHQHRVWQFLPGTIEAGTELVFTESYSGETGKIEGGTLTDFQFPAFLCGQRSLEQLGGTQKFGFTEYLGLATHVDFAAGKQTCCYLNANHATVTCVPAFVGGGSESFQEIVTDLKRP